MVTSDFSDVGLGNFGFGIGGWQPCKNRVQEGDRTTKRRAKDPIKQQQVGADH